MTEQDKQRAMEAIEAYEKKNYVNWIPLAEAIFGVELVKEYLTQKTRRA